MTLDKRILTGTRAYLCGQGIPLAALETETEICQELFRFLVAHRGDRHVWNKLAQSIRQTGCTGLKLCCKDGRQTSLNALLQELSYLKTTLPAEESRQGYQEFRQRLGSGVLAVFLLAASGCYDDAESGSNASDPTDGTSQADTDDTNETDQRETESNDISTHVDPDTESASSETENDTESPESEPSDSPTEPTGTSTESEPCVPSGMEIPENQIDDDCDGQVDCYDENTTCRDTDPLQHTTVNACIESDKTMLCDLFDSLDEDWEEGLNAIFDKGTTQEIAELLDHLAICADYTTWVFDEPFAEKAEALEDRQLCREFIPIYLLAATPPLKVDK